MLEGKQMPIVIAHRGASAYEPENTLRAIRRALALGVPAIEVDVRRTANGELVVMHDANVDRTTSGAGKVVELTLEELRRLDAGQGEHVPTLAEIVTGVGAKAILVIELKVRGLWQAVLGLVHPIGKLEHAIFVSFLGEEIIELLRAYPQLTGGVLLRGRPMHALAKTAPGGVKIVGFREDVVTKQIVVAAHQAGLKVLTWTVNEPARAKELAALGVDFIASDAPDRVMKALAGLPTHRSLPVL